jgi:cellulose synthase/poly-beta-1,6-N-acetylglucosamine synthase-like glycosyltransferase
MLTAYEVFWLFAIPAAIFSWYHIIRNVVGFVSPEGKLPPNPHPEIVFLIAARKLTSIVRDPIDSIVSSCAKVGYSNYKIKVVVDGIESAVEGAEVILVPKDFVCRSRYKARALQYALRYLPNGSDHWVLHLDEDAMVTPQGIVSIVNYIKGGGKPIANGPTAFPWEGNILTFYAEAQRQWTFYWLKDQVMSSTVHWLNGSNLLIRSDIEQQVGWDFPKCFISEDARFGYEATKKYGKVPMFGWHGGLTLEKPAGSVGALIKQRVRWFYGSILNLRWVPRTRLPRRLYSITVWIDGFILTVFFFVMVVGLYHEPWFTAMTLLQGLALVGVVWLGRYELGVYYNLRYSSLAGWKKGLLYIGLVPLAPIIDFICTLPSVWAFVKHPKSFEITAKRR